MCRFTMCESRQYEGEGVAGASGKRGYVFSKGIFLKSLSYVSV